MSFRNSPVDTLLCSGEGLDLAEPLKVSELVAILKADVEQKHRFVRVVGEISSFKQWRSGHCYFDIKDDQALLPAVIFRPHFARVPFAVSDGLLVMFSGRVSIYAANSRLQMIVEAMEPMGQGALALAFQQLTARLKAEGLFDPVHKKPIKSFNACVGLITSSHGAVLRDMVRIIKGRMPKTDILFSPVRVQGAGASAEIARAIELLDQTGACDVIIVGRGGGSLEDLWAFNEEVVARAIFKANTPIISAVGHETDTTISDFVADLRAATPTHAAALAVPELSDILLQLDSAMTSLRLKHLAHVRAGIIRVSQEKRRLKDPRIILFRHWQRLDDSSNRMRDRFFWMFRRHKARATELKQALQQFAPYRELRRKKDAFFSAKAMLVNLSPMASLRKARGTIENDHRVLTQSIEACFRAKRLDFERSVMKLEAISPLKVLARGYSAIEDLDSGRILSKMEHFNIDQQVKIRIEAGVVRALITGKE